MLDYELGLAITGLSPSLASYSKELEQAGRPRLSFFRLQFATLGGVEILNLSSSRFTRRY
jgi:hypothetical protein